MIYEQKITIPSSQKKVKLDVAPCVKCGCDDLKVEEYEDNFGYISNVTCKNKKCNNNTRVNKSLSAVIKEWNNNNDIDSLIENKKGIIARSKEEIKKLTALKKSREIKKNYDAITKTYNQEMISVGGFLKID